MKTSVELRQERASVLEQMKALHNLAESENRDLTADEQSKWDQYEQQAESLNNRIKRAEQTEENERQAAEQENQQRRGGRAPGGEEGEQQKINRRYSMIRAIDLVSRGKALDGLELEMQQEANREARQAKVQPEGHLQIPSMMYRDMTAGTPTQGGHTIQTDVGDIIPYLDPKLQVEALGATMLRGLVGDVKFPRGNADATATWEGENDANSETSPTLDAITLSPNRLGAFTDLSKQLLVQSSSDMEAWVRRRLNFAVRKAVDAACINGSGSGSEPTGILGTSGIGDVVGGTNGAAPDWADIVDLETEIAVDNADMGRLAYLTTPGIRGQLKQTLLDSGSGRFVWDVNSREINGYTAAVSTQVPSTLTKGSSSGVCHAIIFGNWEELMVGQWAGLDLVVDPYTSSKNALVTLVINSWWDVAVRHAQSFAAMKDALVS